MRWVKLTPWVSRVLLDNDCSWVTNIGNEKVPAISKNTHASGATVTHVSAHVANLIIRLLESNRHCWMYLAERGILEQVMVLHMTLQVVLDKHRESMFEERANFAPIGAMTIAYWEEMAVLQTHDMRIRNVRILVNFVRVVGRDTSFGGKRELRNYIYDLMLIWFTRAIFITIFSGSFALLHWRLWMSSSMLMSQLFLWSSLIWAMSCQWRSVLLPLSWLRIISSPWRTTFVHSLQSRTLILTWHLLLLLKSLASRHCTTFKRIRLLLDSLKTLGCLTGFMHRLRIFIGSCSWSKQSPVL